MSLSVTTRFFGLSGMPRICNVYSMVGRSIADIRPEVTYLPPRSNIEAIDLPTVLYIYILLVG